MRNDRLLQALMHQILWRLSIAYWNINQNSWGWPKGPWTNFACGDVVFHSTYEPELGWPAYHVTCDSITVSDYDGFGKRHFHYPSVSQELTDYQWVDWFNRVMEAIDVHDKLKRVA